MQDGKLKIQPEKIRSLHEGSGYFYYIEPDVYVLHRCEHMLCVHLCVFMWFYFSHFLNSAKKYKPTSLSKEINMTQTRTFDWFLQDLTNKTTTSGKGFIWQAMELQIWIQNYQPVSFMWTVLTTLEYSSNNPGRNSGKTDVERILKTFLFWRIF